MNNLKAFRQEHGLSQSQVATLLHTSKATVSRWEAGISAMPEMAWELLQLKLLKSGTTH